MSKSQKKLKWHPVICRAIRKKAVIQFNYHGTQRSVEPQSHGISSAKNEVIRGVQTNPFDPSGKQIEGKFYKVSEMTDLKETGESFSKPGPHFNPNDRGMIYVHCSLAPAMESRRQSNGPSTSKGQKSHKHSKSISYSEIKKKYRNEWVLVEFSSLGKDLHPKTGQVLAHASNKEEIYRALLQTRGKNVSIEYFGPLSADIAVIFCLEPTR